MVVDGVPAPRLMLHAASLTFPHPAGGERRIEAPIPPDMLSMLEGLGLAVPPRWNAPGPIALDHQGTDLLVRG